MAVQADGFNTLRTNINFCERLSCDGCECGKWYTLQGRILNCISYRKQKHIPTLGHARFQGVGGRRHD